MLLEKRMPTDTEKLSLAKESLQKGELINCLQNLTALSDSPIIKQQAEATYQALQQQLSLAFFNINARRFSQLTLEEFLDFKNTLKKPNSSLMQWIDLFNEIMYFLRDNILSSETPSQQKKSVRFWFDLMLLAEAKNDFMTMTLIHGCLTEFDSPIESLTKKYLARKEIAKLDQVTQLFEAKGQYQEKRKLMESKKEPAIFDIFPYFNTCNMKLAGISNRKLQLQEIIDKGSMEEQQKAREGLATLAEQSKKAFTQIYQQLDPNIQKLKALDIHPPSAAEKNLETQLTTILDNMSDKTTLALLFSTPLNHESFVTLNKNPIIEDLIKKIPATIKFQTIISKIAGVAVTPQQATWIKQHALQEKIKNDELRALIRSQSFILKHVRGSHPESKSMSEKTKQFKTTREYVEEIDRVLTHATENPTNPEKWAHVSYLITLFEEIGIDIHDDKIRQFLADYHKNNPDTVKIQPSKYKHAARIEDKEKAKSQEGVAKSAHAVKRAYKTYPTKPDKEQKDIFAKTNEMQQAEFESAMGEIYGLLLEEGAPKSRVVVDEKGLVIGTYSVGVRLKDFTKMNQTELRAKNLAQTRIAANAVAKYFMAEDDWHQENVDVNYVIDHDMSLWPVAIKYKGNVRGKPPEFDITARDIENFPDIKDAKPHYWPTKPELKSHPKKGYFYSPHGRYVSKQFIALKNNDRFNHEKYYYFMKSSLMEDALIDEAVDAHVSSLTMRQEIKASVKERRNQLLQTLPEVPSFRKILLQNRDQYLERLMNDSKKYNDQFHGKSQYESRMIDIEARKKAFLNLLETCEKKETTFLINHGQIDNVFSRLWRTIKNILLPFRQKPTIATPAKQMSASPLDRFFVPALTTEFQKIARGRCLTAAQVCDQATIVYQKILANPSIDASHQTTQQLRIISIEIDALTSLSNNSQHDLGVIKEVVIKRLEELKKIHALLSSKITTADTIASKNLAVTVPQVQKLELTTKTVADEGRYVVSTPTLKLTSNKQPVIAIIQNSVIYENPEKRELDPEREKIAHHALAKIAAKKFKGEPVLMVTSGTAHGSLTEAEAKQAAKKIAKYLALESPQTTIFLDGKEYKPKQDWRSLFFGGTIFKEQKNYKTNAELIKLESDQTMTPKLK